ncbi:MAG TPA: lectin like domain-containing protein [Bryobacteraceae bacterium]|nr:lectin like domain-containing protein [Bryobacteraceae bacterium]
MKTSRFLAAALLLAVVSAAQERQSQGHIAPLNPEYVKYLTELRQGKTESFGYIPPTVDLSYLNSIPFSLQDVLGATPLPASYDLRKFGRVSPVGDQGNCGSCWTFATMGSLESALLPGEARSFSENNLKDTQGRDASPCTGGNALQAMAYLARWSGPVNASDDPYQPTNVNSSPVYTTPAKHVQDVLMIPGRQNPTDNDNLKRAVMTYGGVWISIYYDTSNYNSTTKSYNYMPPSTDTLKSRDHAITLIGWDDNYDRNLFSNPPPGDGAFLMKNSWGTKWGDAGYFWLSYYDALAGYVASFAFYGEELTSNWSRIYQYDAQGWVSAYGRGSDTIWFANVFTAQDTESIGAVSFYALTPNVSYTASVYTSVENGPTSGTLASSTTGTLATAGYHTVRLDTPVGVTAGSRFAAVVKVQATGITHPVAIQNEVDGMYSTVTGKPGQGYTSADGSSWHDITSFDPTASVCLKAFANKAGSGNVPVTVASNPPGQTVTVDGTDYSSAKAFNWATGTSHTLSTTTPQGAGTSRYAFSNWSDGGARTHDITISQAGTYTANFLAQYQVTTSVSPSGSGSVAASPTSSDHFYTNGTAIQFTATAASGYVFDHWSSGLSGTASPGTLTINQALTVTAVFRSNSASTVTTDPAGLNIVVDGSTYAAPHNFTWSANSTHTINAPSPQGTGTRYAFASWSDKGAQSHTVTAGSGASTYTASFTPQYQLTVQANPSTGGSVTETPSSSDGYFAPGTTVSVRAVAGSGYVFSGWGGALTGSTNPAAVTMSGPRTVVAQFGTFAAGPANDEIAGALAIGRLPSNSTENTGGATSNSSDPTHTCTGQQDSRTVWFTFVPNFTGIANISTMNSDYDTVLSAYSGSDGTELACNDDENELTSTSAISLGVTQGQAIIVEVSAYGAGAGGNLALAINGQALQAAANDELSSATEVPSLPSNFSQITKTATTNSSDPYHTCTGVQDGSSVWFRWVATYTGHLRVNTLGSDYDTVVTGYSGLTGDELACNDDMDDSTTASEIQFHVTQGRPYYIEVTSWNGGPGGLLVLNAMAVSVPPDNDSIDNAFGIPGLPFTIQEDTVNATEDDYDPWHTCTGDWDVRTVWFYYTATTTGRVRINTFGTDYDTVLSIYDGDSGDEIACNDDASDDTYQSAVDLDVTAGKTYWIEVSEYNDEYATGGTLFLNLVGSAGDGGSVQAASRCQQCRAPRLNQKPRKSR